MDKRADMDRSLIQRAADGRTRTFRFDHSLDRIILDVDIRGPAGERLGEDLSYHFTNAEFEAFRKLVEGARP